MRRLLFVALICFCGVLSASAAEDYYKVLGVSNDSDDAQIKKAFRKLSLKYHPDKTQGDPEAQAKYVKISEAYEILSNPDKRQIYDIHGEEGLKAGGNPRQGNSIFDLFGGGGGGGVRKGPNFEMQFKVTLEELYNGGTKSMNVARQVICKKCRGTGAKGGDVSKCKSCKGKGVVMTVQQLGPGFNVQMQQPCGKCGGKGNVPKESCPECAGKKTVREGKQLDAIIERGMPDGHRLVFERASEQSPDTVPGDVILIFQTQPHPTFTRAGNDLHMDMTISLREALLGFSRTIRHLDDREVVISMDGVTRPEQVKTMRGEGMPHHEVPAERGNLHVKFTIDFPKKLTAEQQAAIKNLLPV